MFRRQQFDKVNPRNVAPSRHTIFIRGLPGSTDVTKVKEYFSGETNSKCSVDFFSTSEDKKRLSVAIRFRSHDLAREMLMKYNNKPLMGFPVELTWFKDLKKARAKMFEEQRQNGNRTFQRQGFRGGFRGNDRRTIVTSPDDFDSNRRVRAGSSSSGGNMGSGLARSRYSRSRSRSFSGSSSASRSRSISGSPHTRRNMSRNPMEEMRNNVRGFSDGQPGSFVNRQTSRNFSCRSASVSSSSSRSSPGMRMRHGSATGHGVSGQKSQSLRYQHIPGGGTSPLNYSQPSRKQRLPGSPESGAPDYTFSNAPAPDTDGGSSLVSGLIQLKRRNQPALQDKASRHGRRASIGSTSSGISGDGSRGNVDNSNPMGKHIPSISPPLHRSASRPYKSHKSGISPSREPMGGEDPSEFPKRKRQKLIAESPDSLSPPTIKTAYLRSSKPVLESHNIGGRQQTPTYEQPVRSHMIRAVPPKTLPTTSVSPSARENLHRRSTRRRSPSVDASLMRVPDGRSSESERWSQTRKTDRKSKIARDAQDSHINYSSESEEESRTSQKLSSSVEVTADSNPTVQKPEKSETVAKEDHFNDAQKDALDLIRQRKEELAQDYKRDCDAFTVVVRTLISKDAELEGRLMPMLKEILHERGQRCIEELRTFIASAQSESEAKSDTMEVSAA